MSYKDLKSFEQATIVYDLTADFVKTHIESQRLKEQMLHAARSGKQNIAEGSSEKTSKKSELKLLGIARASFQELLEDYEDFLRQRSLRQWEKDSPQARAVRELAYKTNRSYLTYKSYMDSPEGAANAAICLINQANYLLDRQIKVAEEKFVQVGGYTENLRRKREGERKKKIIGRFWRKHFE